MPNPPTQDKDQTHRENWVALFLVAAFIIIILSVGLASTTPFTYGNF
jgi:hypothetical protein